MSKIEVRGAPATALRELGEEGSAVDPKPGSESAAIPAAPFAPIAPDQLARDMAEIERAAAALRRAEPALEPRAPEPQTGSAPRTPGSIWPLVCVIWLMAAAVVSCAIGTMVLLLG